MLNFAERQEVVMSWMYGRSCLNVTFQITTIPHNLRKLFYDKKYSIQSSRVLYARILHCCTGTCAMYLPPFCSKIKHLQVLKFHTSYLSLPFYTFGKQTFYHASDIHYSWKIWLVFYSYRRHLKYEIPITLIWSSLEWNSWYRSSQYDHDASNSFIISHYDGETKLRTRLPHHNHMPKDSIITMYTAIM